jgi:LemA protein
VVVAVFLVATVAWTAGSRSGLLGLLGLIRESWRQVEEEMVRRHELVPGLVRTVRSHAPLAGPLVDAVLVALAAAAQEPAGPGSVAVHRQSVAVHRQSVAVHRQSVAEAALTAELGRVFTFATCHPLLAADQDFLALQQELRQIEDRIAAGRRHYNDAVQTLNARLDRFPSGLVAWAVGIHPVEPFSP